MEPFRQPEPGPLPEMEVREFLWILWRRRAAFLVIALPLALAAVFLAWSEQTVYEAEAAILYPEDPRAILVDLLMLPDTTGVRRNEPALDLEARVLSEREERREWELRRRAFMTELVRSPLVADRVLQTMAADGLDIHRTASELLNAIEPRTHDEWGRQLWIAARASEPEAAARLANAWALAYSEVVSELSGWGSRFGSAVYSGQVERLREQHRLAHQELLHFLADRTVSEIEARPQSSLDAGEAESPADRGPEKPDRVDLGLGDEATGLEVTAQTERELRLAADEAWVAYSTAVKWVAYLGQVPPGNVPEPAVQITAPALSPTVPLPRSRRLPALVIGFGLILSMLTALLWESLAALPSRP